MVDDHEAFRVSAAALLEADGFSVVGTAVDGRAALTECRRLQPEIVLLDVQLPDTDGFAVAEQLVALDTPPHVVLISTHARRTFGSRLDSAAGSGFLTKRELSGPALAALVE